MQTTEKKELKKEKSDGNNLFIVTANEKPPREQQKFISPKASKKEIVHKRRHRPDCRPYVFTLEKVRVHKTIPLIRPLSGTTN
jgi:hypothetical protein